MYAIWVEADAAARGQAAERVADAHRVAAHRLGGAVERRLAAAADALAERAGAAGARAGTGACRRAAAAPGRGR